MIISNSKGYCVCAGWLIKDQVEKEYDGKKFVELALSVGKDENGENLPIINVTVWRKMFAFKEHDRVFVAGRLAKRTKDDKVYYSMTADFIAKEDVFDGTEQPKQNKQTNDFIDDDSLPF